MDTSTKNKCCAVIPARGGSKGVPGKNIKLLNGKPLLQYTVDSLIEAEIKGDGTLLFKIRLYCLTCLDKLEMYLPIFLIMLLSAVIVKTMSSLR
ncbi:MAG: hypothetical protein HOE45_09235, partial [Gammaproteobacteria bacterium]|nr:hypothetical protein [Gammaproteobacteria bacterium]